MTLAQISYLRSHSPSIKIKKEFSHISFWTFVEGKTCLLEVQKKAKKKFSNEEVNSFVEFLIDEELTFQFT